MDKLSCHWLLRSQLLNCIDTTVLYIQEMMAQRVVAEDPDCYAWIVCSQERPGDATCPVTIIGRAQLMFTTTEARVSSSAYARLERERCLLIRVLPPVALPRAGG